MALTFSTSEKDSDLVLSLVGQLDALSAPELMPTIDSVVAQKRSKIVVDLAGLDLIDSSGVAAIVALYKRCKSTGGNLQVTNARDQPLAIFKLLRMDKVFQMS